MAIANKLNFPLHGDRKLANKVQYAGDPDPVMVFVGGKPRFYLGWRPDNVSSLVQWLEGGVSGPWMLDSANTGDDRILNNGPGLQRGRCVDLDGISQRVVISSSSELNPTSALSVSVFAKNNNAAMPGVQMIAAKYLTTGSKRQWALMLNASGKIQIYISGDGVVTNVWQSTSAITTNQFNHYAFTYTASSLKVYINGSEIAGSFTSGSLPCSLHADTNDLEIGSYLNGFSFWYGSVFGLHVYDAALSADSVAYLHDASVGTDPGASNLVGRWLLDEQSGSTHYDSSGNGNNATAYNSPTHSTQNLKSWQDDEGYSKSGAVYIPRDESNTSNDVLGNPLDFSGSAPLHAQLLSPAGTFDGVDDYLSIPSLTGSETVTSSGGTSTPTISAGRIDFTAGTCWDLQLSNGDRYVFSEKDGTTIHNVTANARHATLTNASLASFWAATQTEFAWGCNNGYRLDGSTLIPAQVGGLVAADGNAITNPPGFNGASELDHDPYTVPKLDSGNLDGVTPPSAHALGDSVVDAAQHFIRQTATKEDRVLLFS